MLPLHPTGLASPYFFHGSLLRHNANFLFFGSFLAAPSVVQLFYFIRTIPFCACYWLQHGSRVL